jgi:hypothetical protein
LFLIPKISTTQTTKDHSGCDVNGDRALQAVAGDAERVVSLVVGKAFDDHEIVTRIKVASEG